MDLAIENTLLANKCGRAAYTEPFFSVALFQRGGTLSVLDSLVVEMAGHTFEPITATLLICEEGLLLIIEAKSHFQ